MILDISAAVTSIDTRCPPKTIAPTARENIITLTQSCCIKIHFTCQFAYKHTRYRRSTSISSPLPKDHTRSRPARLRFCRDEPDGRDFDEVTVQHLVLFGPGQRLQFGGGFRAPVCHELILGLTVVHHHLLRLLPKHTVWKTERKGTGKMCRDAREKHSVQ